MTIKLTLIWFLCIIFVSVIQHSRISSLKMLIAISFLAMGTLRKKLNMNISVKKNKHMFN